MKQLWNDQRSILLTRAVVALAIAGSVVMTVCGPKITHWMVTAHGLPPRSGPLLLGMGYACAALALVMLCSLYQFLRRIEAGEVFVSTNVAALRCISWCCAGAAGFCLLAAGGGGRVHGAHRPGAEKRLCAGRPHEGRAGLHRVRGASRCLLWSIWMS